MTDWTDEQKDAITRRGSDLLVSAAAGSGKTAVLANRVVKYVENGGSLDRLLVVTFTRLAAGEMRERIGKLLQNADFADKTALRKQKLLLCKAKICTIDSFFTEIVRENFRVLNISPDFRLLDDAEYSYIKTDILRKLTEEYYADYHGNFGELIRLFGGDGEDEKMTEQISRLYTFLQALPFPSEWANAQREAYRSPETWIRTACEELLPEVKEFLSVYEEIIDELPFSDKGMAVLYGERDLLRDLKEKLENRDFDGAKKAASYDFERAPACKADDRTMQKFKLFRAKLKDFLAQPLFVMDTAVLLSDLDAVRDGIGCLLSMTLEYSARVFAEMKRKNAYSFDAVSHMALELTVKRNEDGELCRTEYAETLSSSFDEILIDEYQDVNDLQDCFFTSISRKNCFAVGDVKQSIYMFRQANPDNFLSREQRSPVIYLNKNFRSRSGVLDFCNFVFGAVFSKPVGGMEYGANEALYCGADYAEKDGSDAEIALLCEEDGADSAELQARYTARKIRQMIASGLTVGKNGEERRADFGDFAIIMRSISPVIAVWERVFFEENVPCWSKSGGNFLDSPEAATVLAFLKAIDNPYDDLSLFAAMFSPIGGFTADETAKIKLSARNEPLFEALKKSAENDEKAKNFVDFLEKFRLIAGTYPVHKLVWEIYEQTGYPSVVSCMELGDLRRERLMSLYAFARSYGEKRGGSLYDFLRFADDAAQSPSSDASSAVPSGNFVKIMTIHGSKGLEFPVVFVPHLDKKFNPKDFSQPLMIEKSAGLGTNLRDEELIYEQTTFMREAVMKRTKRRVMSENLRLLYVAFTRAREKLILVSSGKKYDEKTFAKNALLSQDGKVCPSAVLSAQSFEDILLMSLSAHPRCHAIHTAFSDISEEKRENVTLNILTELPENKEIEVTKSTELDITVEEVIRRCKTPTKTELSTIPAKLSVTEIAKNLTDDDKSEELIPRPQTVNVPAFLSGPLFLAEQTELTGAQAGTAIHTFLSRADLRKPFTDELRRLTDEKFLDQSQAEAVKRNRRRIEAFAKSDLYAKMCSAKCVRREEYFISSIPSEAYSSGATGGNILIQGAIDVLCDMGESLMIVDYKTDHADEDELKARYEKQLVLYADAAEKCFGKPVSEIWLWSLHLSEKVEIRREKR